MTARLLVPLLALSLFAAPLAGAAAGPRHPDRMAVLWLCHNLCDQNRRVPPGAA